MGKGCGHRGRSSDGLWPMNGVGVWPVDRVGAAVVVTENGAYSRT